MKMKSKKGPTPRHQPAHFAHVVEPEQEAPAPRAALFPIFKQLTSENAADREFACAGVANALLDSSVAPQLVEQGVSHVLIRCLADAERAVQVEAAGALRNLCVNAGETVCQRLVDENIFSPLAAFLLARVSELPRLVSMLANADLDPEDKLAAEQSVSGLEHALHVVWQLCEVVETAVSLVTSHDLLPAVLECVRAEVPVSLASVAAQCLLTLSEDNPSVVALAERNADCLPRLSALLASSPALLLRVNVAGVFFNLRACVPHEILAASVLALAAAVAEDSGPRLAALAPRLPQVFAADAEPSPDQAALEELQALLNTQQTALEVLANVCASDDSGDSWEDVADGDAMEEEEEEGDGTQGAAAAADSAPQSVPALLGLVLESGVAPKLLQRFAPLSRELESAFGAHALGAALLKKYAEVQLRAVACVGNLLENIPAQALGAAEAAGLWSALCALGTHTPTHASSDFVVMLTSTLWTLVRSCRRTPATASFLAPGVEEVKGFAQLAVSSDNEQVRCNCVGLLGALALYPSVLPLLSHIGEALLHSVTGDPSPWVLAEGLNSVMDVFAEAEVNAVVVALDMVAKLQAVLPACRAKLKELRRAKADRHLVGRLSDACLNLKRFIDYKRQQF